ncbi:hypothetical protein NP569_25805, partial [Vibrio parahaemolyticus]|nr:hypothetical protein [Vibrio parahaemolyticus]
ATFVVPLQNGVEAAGQLAAAVGEERVVGGLCRIVSFVAAPGRIRHAGFAPSIEVGERHGRRSERVLALRDACSRAVGLDLIVADDI